MIKKVIFVQLCQALGDNPMSQLLAQTFLETRGAYASLELLIDLLAYLEPELWPKNPSLHKKPKIAEKARVSH